MRAGGFLMLLAAAILLAFSGGRWTIPLAAWMSPIILLRYVRGGRALPRLAAGLVTTCLVGCMIWWSLVPVPVPAYFAVMVGVMLPTFLPYVADRLLARREDGFRSTLVFPSAWVVTEHLVSRTSPFGSWGLVANTQVDHLPLIQSMAVTGLWGIGFLVAWTAAVANWAWEQGFEWRRVRAGLGAWGGVLGAVLLLGGAWLAMVRPGGPTIRVASFTIPPPALLSPWRLMDERLSGPALDSLRAGLHAHHETLFAAVRREAAAGARLVVWSEVGATVLKDEESAFERAAANVAHEARVHLIAGLLILTPGEGFYENVLAAFDSTGARLAYYHKARPVPGDAERGADREIPVFATSFGRVAGAVCFDADFPDLLVRSGRAQSDLLVVPSSDWRAIDPVHTRMALLRGVENGCSVVRQVNKGLSAAADWQGRILASTDFFTTSPCVMVAQVPARGIRTPYSRFPELVPLLCVLVLAGSAFALLRRRVRRRATP